MSHQPGAQLQPSETHQLLNYPQGGQPPNRLPNVSQDSRSSGPPSSHGHLNPPTNSRSKCLATKRKDWLSWKLERPWMLTLITIDVTLIVSIIYLQHRSSTHNGFVTVPASTESIIPYTKITSKLTPYNLLWTTLPSLVVHIYVAMWATIVSATAFRQPFVDLNHKLNEARSAKTTIMLDYQTYSPINNFAKAWGNRHIILGMAMLLSTILTSLTGSLMASLFVSAATQSYNNITINYTQMFNDDKFDPTIDLQPPIDFASSVHTYHAQPPSWKTENYAFAPFQPITSLGVTLSNLTANTTAYSAQLDCQAFSSEQSNAAYVVDHSGTGTGAVTYSMIDRGCNISYYQTLVNTTPTYSTTWKVDDCSDGSPYGRIGVFGGIYSDSSPTKIANYTLISCIPRYYSTTGLLTVSQATGKPNFISFNETNSTEIKPYWKQTIEDYLPSDAIFDASNNIYADVFGFAVFQDALSQNPGSPFTPASYIPAMEGLYSTLVVQITSSQLLQDVAIAGVGELSTPVQRLYVVDGVAWAVVALLLAALVCNIYLWIYSAVKESILVEEPKGLLGHAGLVVGSDVQGVVEEFRRGNPENGEVRKSIKHYYPVDESSAGMIRVRVGFGLKG